MSAPCLADTMRHSPYTLATRLVHFVLADIANDDHDNLLYPTIGTIATKAGVSTDTVHRALKQMVEDGYLELVIPADRARHIPATYHFVMPSAVRKSEPQIAARPASGPQMDPDRAATNGKSVPQMPERTALLPQVKTTEDNNTSARAREDAFTAFWAVYPRHTGGRGAALSAFKSASAPTFDIMEGARRWAAYWHDELETGRTEMRYIPHPTTWLRQRRWEDEIPTAARAAPRAPTQDDRIKQAVSRVFNHE